MDLVGEKDIFKLLKTYEFERGVIIEIIVYEPLNEKEDGGF